MTAETANAYRDPTASHAEALTAENATLRAEIIRRQPAAAEAFA